MFEIQIPEDYEKLQVRLIYLTDSFSYEEEGMPICTYYTKKVTVKEQSICAKIPDDAKIYYFEFIGEVSGKQLISTSSLIMRES